MYPTVQYESNIFLLESIQEYTGRWYKCRLMIGWIYLIYNNNLCYKIRHNHYNRHQNYGYPGNFTSLNTTKFFSTVYLHNFFLLYRTLLSLNVLRQAYYFSYISNGIYIINVNPIFSYLQSNFDMQGH